MKLIDIVIMALVLLLIYACASSLLKARKSGIPSCGAKGCSGCSGNCALMMQKRNQ